MEILKFNIFFNKSVKILHTLVKSYRNVAEITYLCTDNKAERGACLHSPSDVELIKVERMLLAHNNYY